jgi:release factor glutamine methyltransferase
MSSALQSRLLVAFHSLLIAPMTIAEARRWLEQTLSKAGIESAEAEARWLLERLFLQKDSVRQSGFSHLQSPQISLAQEQESLLRHWLERRVRREPLQHILGSAPFYGLELTVNPDVLIPRPETERLVELVLAHAEKSSSPNLLDVGTGSGAIALALKHERPDATVAALDISAAALRVAKQNAEKYKLDVTWLESDLLQHKTVQTFAKSCDVLVANLPYLPVSDKHHVSPEVLHDPDLALYAGEDGLGLFRRLEREAFKLLRAQTYCFFELDPRNIETAYKLCLHWEVREVYEDLTERRRFLKLAKTRS